MKLLELLYNQENKFIEEIDRLEKNPEEVLFLDAGNDSGLVCLKATENSFDWNIVRPVGDWTKAKTLVGSIPFKESVLLVEEDKDLSDNDNCKRNGTLIYFENSFSSIKEYDSDSDSVEGIVLPKNILKRKASPFNSRIDDLYLIFKNNISGFCKIIKNTWHYSEIVIEINPEYRGQGFGTAILGLMVNQFNEKGLKLSYVVEEDNIPSLKLANTFFKECFRLNKYLINK